MKKITCLTAVLALLTSQTGCVGTPATQEDFPYATPEIKQQLISRIWGVEGPVEEDFLETQSCIPVAKALWQYGAAVLGETIEQQLFWFYLFSWRAHFSDTLAEFDFETSSTDFRLAMEQFAYIGMRLSPFLNEHPEQVGKILDEVVRYEKAHPYDLKKAVENQLKKIDAMSREEFEKKTGESFESDEEFAEAKQELWDELDEIAEGFPELREKFLANYQKKAEQLKKGLSEQEIRQQNKEEQGVAEYAIHFLAPKLYPTQMLFGEFTLTPDEEGPAYNYQIIFQKNGSPQDLGIRLENEKPLPYLVAAAWYSIVENKVYILEGSLPRKILVEKILHSDGKWDALLLTLLPHGKVELYVFSQISNEKEFISQFQAKTWDVSFQRFLQLATKPGMAMIPAQDWQEYQQKSLEQFPDAAQNLAQNGLPPTDANTDYWEEPANHAAKESPQPENLNTPNAAGNTPLLEAVSKNQPQTVEELIKAGADVHYRNPEGETALLVAINLNLVPQVRALLAAGADANDTNPNTGETALITASIIGNEEIVKLLLEAGADVNAKRKINGRKVEENALTLAKTHEHAGVVELLKKAGAQELASRPAPIPPITSETEDVNQADAAGFTPLFMALMAGDLNRMQELIVQGANVNAKVAGVGTPVLFACSTGNVEAVKILANAHANLNEVNDAGMTALMVACSMGNAELAQVLISAGADVNIKQPELGLSALKIAKQAGNEPLVHLLEQAGAQE